MYSGIDVVDIERFSDRIEANAALMQRLFSADELNSCKGALPSLAARFCAKEAALKVLGQADVVAHAACFGSGDSAGCAAVVSKLDDGAGVAGLNFRDIEVTSRPGQAPQLRLHGQVAAWARRLGLHSWRVSLAHDKVAMAQVWASGGPAEGCKVSSHDATLARYLLKPEADSHKYSRGVVRIIAGSQRFPGAGLLCVAGASHSGVGMIRLNAPERVENLVLAAHPQIVPDGPALTGTCDALVLGPGLDAQKADWEALAQLLENTPAVIDASALEPVCALIKEGKLRLHAHHILTPHEGELARCLNLFAGTNTDKTAGEIAGKLADKADKPLGKFAAETSPALQRRIQGAQQLATLTGACVLAKGNHTVVVDAKAQVHHLPAATPWLATAGSGDVLAGLMGGLLALNVRAGARHVGTTAALGSATSADAAGTSQQSADAQGQGTTVASAAALAPEIAQLAARLHALAGQLAAEAAGPKTTYATGPKSASAVVAHPITAPEIAAAIPNAWALYSSAAAN
ncbi:MAG: 4'-phosphopantetheinyl transferase superfamily protein [Actinomyces graevenitzii]|nr:4'-phosphopantetheinyl transferase superfamily protein [Actinomyces graevenitzii]